MYKGLKEEMTNEQVNQRCLNQTPKKDEHYDARLVTEDREQFQKLKNAIGSSHVMTHAGLKQVLPELLKERSNEIKLANPEASSHDSMKEGRNNWTRGLLPSMKSIPHLFLKGDIVTEGKKKQTEPGENIWKRRVPTPSSKVVLAGRRKTPTTFR